MEFTEKEKTKKSTTRFDRSLDNTAGLMNKLFRAPKPYLLVLPTFILSLINGFLINQNNFTFYNVLIINGLFIFAFPTLLSTFLAKVITESIHAVFYWRRSMLLSFICLLIISAILLIANGLLLPFYTINITIIIIFSYAVIIWLRYVVFISIVVSSHVKSIILAIIQSVIGVFCFHLIYPLNTSEWMFLILLFAIFTFAASLFISQVNAPMKKVFGVNGLEILKCFFIHITENKEINKIEQFFESFSEKFDIPLSVLSFKTKKKIKCILILPSIHPGPFGTLGGSNLPFKFYNGLKHISQNIIVPHGASTHDYNLAVSNDCQKMISEIKKLIDDMKYSSKGSQFIRYHDTLDICTQFLGESLVLIHSSAPTSTDDIDTSISEIVKSELEKKDIRKAIFIDAHNAIDQGADCVYFNTRKARKIVQNSIKASEIALDAKKSKMKVGFAQKNDYINSRDGIGPQGIQVLTIEVNNKKNTYIFIDGNNMIIGLREKIQKKINSLTNESEILTTDNHIVNISIGGYNPIGLKINHDNLLDDTFELVKESINDLEECQVGFKSMISKNIRLFGFGNTSRISTTINSTLSSLKINAFSSWLIAFLLSLLSYFFIIYF